MIIQTCANCVYCIYSVKLQIDFCDIFDEEIEDYCYVCENWRWDKEE